MSFYSLQILSRLGLTETQARKLATQLTIGSFDSGHAVWNKDQMPDHWSFIISGVVVGMSPKRTDPRLPMSLHGPQSWFGELCILNQESSVLDYICATDVQLMRMPASLFNQTVATEPAFSAHILRLMSRRARLQLDLIIALKVGSPTMRTMLGLAHIAEALFPSTPTQDVVAVPIKQSLVAAMCGVSRTLLSHYLQELQSAGWVRVHYSRLKLVHPRAWIRLSRHMHRHRLFERQVSIHDMVRELELENG